MSVGRRGFLRLIAAAPVAGPVVAREAAKNAGIAAVGLGVDGHGPSEGSCYPSNPKSEQDWFLEAAKRVFSKGWEDEQRERMRDWYPARLDPDLACSRAFSLSTALRIQRDRNINERIRRERDEARRNYLRVFGFEFIA